MKYGVQNSNDGVIAENTKTDNFETARSTAVALSNWNIPCDVVDLENNDENGKPVVLKHLTPYRELYDNKSNPIRELGARGGIPFSPGH